MFKNWTTQKTIITLVVIAIIAFILYELKVFGNTTTVFNLRKFAFGGSPSGPDAPGGGTIVVARPASNFTYNRQATVNCTDLSASIQSVAARLLTSRSRGDRDALKSLSERYAASGCGTGVMKQKAEDLCWKACLEKGGSDKLCSDLCDWLRG